MYYQPDIEPPTKEKLKENQPYVDIINSFGDFYIEHIDVENSNEIHIDCIQRINSLFVENKHLAMFEFYAGELAEQLKINNPDRYQELNGILCRIPEFIPIDMQLPSVPEITPEGAIQTALYEEPLEEFCEYMLYYEAVTSWPQLSWKLYGKLHYAYVNAITGKVIKIRKYYSY